MCPPARRTDRCTDALRMPVADFALRSGPPGGTVTFLFTDIEGSTRHWQHQPNAMPAALARHDALLRMVVNPQGGHIYKPVGDAFCAAFSRAPDGIIAATETQRRLQPEPWGDVG